MLDPAGAGTLTPAGEFDALPGGAPPGAALGAGGGGLGIAGFGRGGGTGSSLVKSDMATSCDPFVEATATGRFPQTKAVASIRIKFQPYFGRLICRIKSAILFHCRLGRRRGGDGFRGGEGGQFEGGLNGHTAALRLPSPHLNL